MPVVSLLIRSPNNFGGTRDKMVNTNNIKCENAAVNTMVGNINMNTSKRDSIKKCDERLYNGRDVVNAVKNNADKDKITRSVPNDVLEYIVVEVAKQILNDSAGIDI